MSSPSRTRSSARTRSPLALHAFPETSLLPATSALPATSMAFDETPCTCSVCCILKPPHVTFHCRILRARRPVRPPNIPERDFSTCTHFDCWRRVPYPCAQGRPLAFHPASCPLCRLGSSGPSNPSATLRQRV